jgi:hypothetical protein
MNKYEQLIEHIINDQTEQARELFHNIVVEKSRDIYESLIDEQDLAEVGGNEVQDLVQDVQMDEEGISEEEEDDLDMGMDDEEDHHADVGGEEELEDRVVDLEDALDELKAEFDALMGADAGDEAEEFGADEEGSEEEEQQFMEAEEEDEEEEEELDETIVREYVEKVAAPSNKTEGGEVGKAGSVNVNKQSTVAGKNDMGGTSANIVKGGTENGATPKKPQVNNAGNINVPGGKAGNAFAKKESAVKKEESGVAKQSPVAK